MNDLVLQLEKIVDRFHEVSDLIVDPAIISDMIRYVKLNKEYKDLEPIIKAHKEYSDIIGNIETSKEILNSDEDV